MFVYENRELPQPLELRRRSHFRVYYRGPAGKSRASQPHGRIPFSLFSCKKDTAPSKISPYPSVTWYRLTALLSHFSNASITSLYPCHTHGGTQEQFPVNPAVVDFLQGGHRYFEHFRKLLQYHSFK